MKVESSFDINNDGLLDLIVRHLDTLKNGISQSVSLYLADSSSEYRLRNSYNNVLPNYYEHYSLEYLRLTDSIAFKTYPYVDGNPLYKLIFQKDQVHFTLKPFSDEKFDFVYIYNSSMNDYIFYSGKYTVEQNGLEEIFEVPAPIKGNRLKQFTITDYYYYEP